MGGHNIQYIPTPISHRPATNRSKLAFSNFPESKSPLCTRRVHARVHIFGIFHASPLSKSFCHYMQKIRARPSWGRELRSRKKSTPKIVRKHLATFYMLHRDGQYIIWARNRIRIYIISSMNQFTKIKTEIIWVNNVEARTSRPLPLIASKGSGILSWMQKPPNPAANVSGRGKISMNLPNAPGCTSFCTWVQRLNR